MHASIDNMQIYFLFHKKPIKKHFFCSNIQESHLAAEKNLLYEVPLVRKNENQLLSKLFLRFGDIELYKNPPIRTKGLWKECHRYPPASHTASMSSYLLSPSPPGLGDKRYGDIDALWGAGG
jgi:hypothetical protein